MNRALSLYPRRPGERDPDWISRVGATTMGSYQLTWRLGRTFWRALASLTEPGASAQQVTMRVAVRQVFFTGFKALPLVSLVAFLLGAAIVMQTGIVAQQLPGEVSGRLLVALVLREFAPLITAILVAGRSGTAIATELGNMRANFEIFGLASLGINPMRFIVLPRLIAATVSVMVLMVYFGALAMIGGTSVAVLTETTSFDALRIGFAETIRFADLPLFVIKGLGLGAIVGCISCHFGLDVQASPTEVPEKASRAVVTSLLVCVIYNTACTAVFYLIVGRPVQ